MNDLVIFLLVEWLRDRYHATDWGDFPTWLAFLAAVVAGLVGYRLYRVESARDERTDKDRQLAAEDRRLAAEDRQRAEDDRRAQTEERRRSQADEVAAWFDSITPTHADRFNRDGWIIYGAMIRNASNLPIYDLRAIFFSIDHQAGESPDWEASAIGISPREMRALPPNDSELLEVPDTLVKVVEDATKQDVVVAIEFRDAAGSLWRRDARGQLTEISPTRQP
jgi:hypothetical protein